MTKKEKLQAAIKAAMDQWDAILAVAAGADNRDLTDAEIEEIAGLEASIESDTKQLKIIEKREAVGAAVAAPRRQAAPADGVVVPAGATVTVNEPNFTQDPMCGFEDPAEFIGLAIAAGRRGGQAEDERLQYLSAAGSDEQGAYSDPYGGFLVPRGMSPTLLQIGGPNDPIGSRTTQVPMAAPSIEINARLDKNHSSSVTGGLTVSRSSETLAGSSSRMQFEQVELKAKPLTGVTYVTDFLLNASPISFAAIIANGFNEEFVAALTNERLNGTGVGEFKGIMNSPCLITVAKEGSQTADTIVYNNIVKMRSRCWGYQNAVWIANHDTIPQLMTMADAGNNHIWQPSAREDHPDLLLGRPIIFTEFAETVGDKGDIVLGNWTQYLEGTYQQATRKESMHVRFLNNERAFLFTMMNAGACWWNSVLTPKKGSTLSPFVALAARA